MNITFLSAWHDIYRPSAASPIAGRSLSRKDATFPAQAATCVTGLQHARLALHYHFYAFSLAIQLAYRGQFSHDPRTTNAHALYQLY